MKLSTLYNQIPTIQQLKKLRSDIANAIERVFDKLMGTNAEGAEDTILSIIINAIINKFDVDADIVDNDKSSFVAIKDHRGKPVYGIGVPSHIYGRGDGYKWSKIEGIDISPEDIRIWEY